MHHPIIMWTTDPTIHLPLWQQIRAGLARGLLVGVSLGCVLAILFDSIDNKIRCIFGHCRTVYGCVSWTIGIELLAMLILLLGLRLPYNWSLGVGAVGIAVLWFGLDMKARKLEDLGAHHNISKIYINWCIGAQCVISLLVWFQYQDVTSWPTATPAQMVSAQIGWLIIILLTTALRPKIEVWLNSLW